MGSFDVPIKLTFSLGARRTVITEVVGQKKRGEEVGEEGRRSKSDEALSLSFNPIVRVGGREMLSSRTQLGGGDIWLSDDPILMLPIVARSLARLSHASSGAAAMTKMAAIHKCFVILSSFRPRRPPLSRSSALHPTKEAFFLVRPCSPQYRKHDFGGSALPERWFAAPIYLPLSEPSSRAIIRIYTSRRSPSPSTAGDPQRVNFKVVTDSECSHYVGHAVGGFLSCTHGGRIGCCHGVYLKQVVIEAPIL